MIFLCSLSDSKSPQVFRTLLSILASLNNVVVWMVYTCPLISESSSPFNNHLVTVPKPPIMIGMIITFMFHSFFNSLGRPRYLSFFSLSFSFILWSAGTAKSTILKFLFFFTLCHILLVWKSWIKTNLILESFLQAMIGFQVTSYLFIRSGLLAEYYCYYYYL